jgi:hypothetical protein
MQFQLPFGSDNLTVTLIHEAFRSLKQTIVEDNVRNTFKAIGFEFNITQTPCTLLLQEEKLRQSQGFRAIWDADNSMDQLWKRRREARYGWIMQRDSINHRCLSLPKRDLETVEPQLSLQLGVVPTSTMMRQKKLVFLFFIWWKNNSCAKDSIVPFRS